MTRAVAPSAEDRAALLTDYIFTLPAACGALAHATAGGNAHLPMIGPAERAPAVHGTEMYALVGRESRAAAPSYEPGVLPGGHRPVRRHHQPCRSSGDTQQPRATPD